MVHRSSREIAAKTQAIATATLIAIAMASPGAIAGTKGEPACPVAYSFGPSPPEAVPSDLFQARNTTVTVTSVVPKDPHFVSGSVTLLRLDSKGNVIANLGRMYDDGAHGDAHAHDGQYTTQFTYNDPVPAGELIGQSIPVYLVVRANYSNLPHCRQSLSESPVIRSVREITAAENEELEATTAAGSAFLEADAKYPWKTWSQIRKDLAEFLREQPHVTSAESNEGGVSFLMDSGLRSGWMIRKPGMK